MSDFGALPPEINSARMYAGPGSGPLLAAATAWDALAAELESFAIGYSSTLGELHGQSWSGASAWAMAAAAEPYVTWATTTAGQAQEVADRARAAVSAYEAAFAATVPPAVVAANRVLLAALVATNFFGQNSPAIAATEAVYAEMWAQDATAMSGYAASASAASALTSFDQPPQTTSPVGQFTQSGGVGQAVNTSAANSQATLAAATLPTVAQPEASTTSVGTSILDAVAPISALDYGLDATILGYEIPKTSFQGGSYFLAAQRTSDQRSDLPVALTPILGGTQTGQIWAPSEPSGTVLAGMSRAASIGELSVPQGWPAATPATSPISEAVTTGRGARALPPWVGSERTVSAGIPAAGRIPGPTGRRQTNAVYRMRDRRYRMPRPSAGG